MLLLDDDQADEGVRLLRAAAPGPAGILADLFGQPAAAAELLARADPADASLAFLRGNAALAAGRIDVAQSAFADAARASADPADRRYAADRLVATARQDGTLGRLVDAWLTDPNLPADRLLPLATTLRELGRGADLLAWWRRAAVVPAWSAVALSHPMVDEVVGAATDAGRTVEAEAVCRDLLARQPDDPRWMAATVQVLVDGGRPSDADAMLRARAAAGAADPDALRSLGKLARSLGRDYAALAVADALERLGGGNRIDGLLLAAAVRQRQGDRPTTAALLRRAAALAVAEPAAVPRVAAALGGAGLIDDQIHLLRADPASAADEDVQQQVATLLVIQHRPAEAAAVFECLRQTGASDATRQQAAQRLLDLAATEAGGLDALVARLEGKLKAAGNAADLTLLADADLRAHRPAAAEDLLRSTPLLAPLDRLHALCTLYLRQRDLARAADVLRQLADADPENAVPDLERLASVELEQRHAAEAAGVVGRIERKLGPGEASAEVLGGLSDRLGQPLDAAAQYRRALALGGDNPDDWLLWSAAMVKAGRRPEAIARLQVLAADAKTDAVFIAAVDGLLNADAPAPVIRAVRREAAMRAACSPATMALYHVLGDLCDELQDRAASVRVAEVTVALSRDERPQALRSLLGSAGDAGQVDLAIDCGRSVLALGDDLPPQMFLDLGGQLLAAGRAADAARAFSRASDVSSLDLAGPRAAELYDRYGDPAAGLGITTRLLARNPYDLTLHEMAGAELERAGRPAEAFEQDLLPLAAAIGALLPTEAAKLPDTHLPRTAPPAEATLNRLVAAAAVTARTPDSQDRLSTLLATAARRLAASAPPSGGEPTTDVTTVAVAVRHVAFAVGRPAVADDVDRALLQRWPASAVLRAEGFNDRWQYGFYDRAEAFGRAYPSTVPDDRNDLGVAQGPSTAPTTTTSQPAVTGDPSAAAAVLPGLMLRGRHDQARTVLAAVSPGQVRSGDAFATFVATAAVLGDRPALRRFGDAWLDLTLGRAVSDAPAAPGTPSSEYADVESVQRVAAALARLSTADHLTAVTDRLLRGAGSARSPVVARGLQAAAVRVADACGTALPADVDVVARWEKPNAFTTVPDEAIELFERSPASQRPAVLRRVLAYLPAPRRLQFLLRVVADVADPFDDATADAVIGGCASPARPSDGRVVRLVLQHRPAARAAGPGRGRAGRPLAGRRRPGRGGDRRANVRRRRPGRRLGAERDRRLPSLRAADRRQLGPARSRRERRRSECRPAGPARPAGPGRGRALARGPVGPDRIAHPRGRCLGGERLRRPGRRRVAGGGDGRPPAVRRQPGGGAAAPPPRVRNEPDRPGDPPGAGRPVNRRRPAGRVPRPLRHRSGLGGSDRPAAATGRHVRPGAALPHG